MDPAGRSIWIDLDNAPHVPLFAPIIRHFRDAGVNVLLTARDHAKTVELLRLKGFNGTFETIGHHYGAGKISKVKGLIERSLQLRSHIKHTNNDIAVAISHGSRSMVLAAKTMGIPVLTMYDYEFTETRIFNAFSNKVLVPDGIPKERLDSIGLDRDKRVRYAGIKEELYVSEFRPNEEFRGEFLERLGVVDRQGPVLVLVRPPATTANYHSGDSALLVSHLLERLLSAENTFTVIVPRTSEQDIELQDELKTAGFAADRYTILNEVVDGLELIYAADIVISGGGTMNREAALLGTPVYSIFSGRQGSLDEEMERRGVIRFIRSGSDVAQIELKQKPDRRIIDLPDRRVEEAVIEQINSFL